MLNVYVLTRNDEIDYDEYDEVTVVAESKERALEIGTFEKYGDWIVTQVNLNEEQILTESFCAG